MEFSKKIYAFVKIWNHAFIYRVTRPQLIDSYFLFTKIENLIPCFEFGTRTSMDPIHGLN